MAATSYTIVRNGVIKRGPLSEHHCGFKGTTRYPYRVEITVRGKLEPPAYFIVPNETIDDYVQMIFKHAPTVSCERMAEMICESMLTMMQETTFEAQKIHVELTGTNGRALLSCDWQAS